MASDADTSSAQGNQWQGADGHALPRTSRRHGLAVTLAVGLSLLSCVLGCGWGQLGGVATLTGLPDPYFGGSVTYTPEQGPPNPILLDTRPETIVTDYIRDYIQVAGTFPCAADLQTYDSFRDGLSLPCPIRRPVASYAVTSVTIQPQGFEDVPLATVHYLMHYEDGTQWASHLDMVPYRFQKVVGFHIHLDCWLSGETYGIFGRAVPEVPRGVSYGPPDAPYLCQPHGG